MQQSHILWCGRRSPWPISCTTSFSSGCCRQNRKVGFSTSGLGTHNRCLRRMRKCAATAVTNSSRMLASGSTSWLEQKQTWTLWKEVMIRLPSVWRFVKCFEKADWKWTDPRIQKLLLMMPSCVAGLKLVDDGIGVLLRRKVRRGANGRSSPQMQMFSLMSSPPGWTTRKVKRGKAAKSKPGLWQPLSLKSKAVKAKFAKLKIGGQQPPWFPTNPLGQAVCSADLALSRHCYKHKCF